jgi:hypothetical protein
VPGVIQINIDDEQHAIHIYADNAQAAKEARHVGALRNFLFITETLDFGIYRRTLLGASTARRTNHRPEGQINSGTAFSRTPFVFIFLGYYR